LKVGKAVLGRGELHKELFLGELLFRETAVAFVALDDFSRYIVTWKLFAPCASMPLLHVRPGAVGLGP
jgi:hypothetical protein